MRLSDAQRKLLYELVILGETPLKGKVKKAREPLLAEGLARLEKNPQGRGEIVVATEKGWAQVVDHLDEPFTHGSLNPRRLWNHLAARLSRYLEARGENLASVLSGPEEATGETSTEDPAAHLHQIYLETSGGRLGWRVRVAELRERAALEPEVFDETLRRLYREGAIVLYPDDERSRLTERDRSAAVVVSGVPQHVVYWERGDLSGDRAEG